jgi:peptide/nickel transport system substrate-binding protein
MDAVRKPHSDDEVKRMIEQSGYNGERLVFMHPTDQLIYHATSTVAVDRFRKVGVNVDEQMTDWGTIVQRRTSKEPLDKGGWSMFPAGAPGPEFVDPLLQNTTRSNGAKAWFGWPDDPKLEAAYEAWIDAPTDAERRKQEVAFQAAAFNSVPVIPLGQYLPHAAWRSNLTGLVKGSAPVFWGVEKG